ncbi:N-acetyltransferase family protein [Herbiconiux sp. YIM B11900]|uniref:GNAT family N-acetyltransferase n=1 Tax=Herbiconiux sp. YIM B11900 TaxID=3404131 RepID=UPI003F8716B9
MMSSLLIRSAGADDAAACAEVYGPYVDGSVITFETVRPSATQMAERIADAQQKHAWLVAESDGGVLGYAYAHRFNGRAAYDWSCETSIYLAPTARGHGVGRMLYGALLDRLVERGLRRAFAGVTLPNDASLGLHRAFGFTDAGLYRAVGWKDGRWLDVAWLQRDLGHPGADPLAPPVRTR